MAVPSRVFVGMVVFGLIASLVTVPLAILVMSGYTPPPEAPYESLFPEGSDRTFADKVVLVLAALFSVAFTFVAFRLLIEAARRDAEARRGRGRSPETKESPPGYG